MRIATEPMAPRIAASVIIRLRRVSFDDVGQGSADRAVGAIDGRKMPLAEQQRNAVLHHDAAQRVAHAGSAVPQRNVFAARAPLLMELVRQDIVNLPSITRFRISSVRTRAG